MGHEKALNKIDEEWAYRPRERFALLGAMILFSLALNFVTLPFAQIVDPVRRGFRQSKAPILQCEDSAVTNALHRASIMAKAKSAWYL